MTNGYEVEGIANPTKNLTLRLTYSYSQRQRENLFPEIFAFFEPRIVEWRQLLRDSPTQLAAFESQLLAYNDEMSTKVTTQNAPFATRPHKASASFRYKFGQEGRLRGAFVGGSLRFNSKNLLNIDQTTKRTYWGNETLFGDAFAGYRTRIPRTKVPLTLQLNVKNISNSYHSVIGRYNNDYSGLRRVYLNEPRSYRFTTTLEF